MKFLHEKLKQLSKAMEFVNIDRIDELETMLESRKVSAAAKTRAAVVRRVAYCERKRSSHEEQAKDFGSFAAPAMLKLSGQR